MFMSKIIFWGSGNLGRKLHRYWQDHNLKVDYFCNNDKKTWGTVKDGVGIISPAEAVAFNDSIFFITCSDVDTVTVQLQELGIEKSRIIRADSFCSRRLNEVIEKILTEKKHTNHELKYAGCYIDLSCGMVLGGVERWSYSLAKSLLDQGLNGRYLVPSDSINQVQDNTYPTEILGSNKGWLIDECVNTLLNGEYSAVICNFPFDVFAAACIVKRMYKDVFKLIAVVHNDEQIYYDVYSQYKDQIDYCLVISSTIKKKMVEKGFPETKLIELYWKIEGDITGNREYTKENEPIKIGYSGRIVKFQKRIDLMMEVAKRLKEKNIKFEMKLVGTGDYETELENKINEYNLKQQVFHIGIIPHDEIFEFWRDRDICISCSDFEGHSISHSEAMACGVVPVITNTSGAADDVIDGYNGFVVDIEDVDAIVNKIEYLYDNRKDLEQMGNRGRKIILDRNEKMDTAKFWFPLLNK